MACCDRLADEERITTVPERRDVLGEELHACFGTDAFDVCGHFPVGRNFNHLHRRGLRVGINLNLHDVAVWKGKGIEYREPLFAVVGDVCRQRADCRCQGRPAQLGRSFGELRLPSVLLSTLRASGVQHPERVLVIQDLFLPGFPKRHGRIRSSETDLGRGGERFGRPQAHVVGSRLGSGFDRVAFDQIIRDSPAARSAVGDPVGEIRFDVFEEFLGRGHPQLNAPDATRSSRG